MMTGLLPAAPPFFGSFRSAMPFLCRLFVFFIQTDGFGPFRVFLHLQRCQSIQQVIQVIHSVVFQFNAAFFRPLTILMPRPRRPDSSRCATAV